MKTPARPLRVGFAPLLPTTSAATRAFCIDPQRELKCHGIQCRMFLPSSARTYLAFYRRGRHLRRLRAFLYWYGIVGPRRLVQIPRMLSCDVLFVQRALFRYTSWPILERLVLALGRPFGLRLVVHCDDALYLLRPRAYRARFALADCVLTGNRDIADFARSCGASVTMVTGAVDVKRYPERKRTTRMPVVIGWAGHAPERHLGTILDGLARVCADHEAVVKVVGDEQLHHPDLGSALVCEPWTPERKFAVFGEFDIGVMPLEDTPMNRAKEGFKIKEYMASGLPVVCSPVGQNVELVEDGVTGFFAVDENEWVERVGQLVRDSELRHRLGQTGRRVALERHDLPQLTARLYSVFIDVVSRGVPDKTDRLLEKPR